MKTVLQNEEFLQLLYSKVFHLIHHRDVVLPVIIKIIGALIRHICSGIVIVIDGWIGKFKLLDCKSVTFSKKGEIY